MKKALLKKLLLSGKIFFGLVLVLVIIVSVFPLLPPFKNYYHSRTVLTGSMEPKIPKGSVVINQWADQKDLKIGDIITYQHPSDKKIIYVTHRIVEIDKTGLLWRFETKGDANPASDFGLITQAGTEGKVILTIPLIGYLIEFFKTPIGFILLIALPLLIFIVRQTRDVWQMWKKRKVPPAPKALVAILLAFSFLAARVSFVTYASFTSGQAAITGVTLSTAASFPGDVVVNEVMWMGSSGNEYDEWLELRNTTGSPADLTGWKIDGAGSDFDSITLSGTIGANGYFLISNYDSSNSAIDNTISVDLVVPGISLNNDGEQLTLKSASGVTIDQTPSGAWAAGTHTSPATVEQSMERNDNPTTGWHTCINGACNDTTYWDTEGNNYGTPKAANLSENDSTSPDYVAPAVTPTPTPTVTPELSSESSATSSATTVEPTPTPSPTPEISSTPTPTTESAQVASMTPTPEPSSTPISSPSSDPSPTASPEPSPSPSPEPTLTPALTPEPTPTLTPTPSPTSEL